MNSAVFSNMNNSATLYESNKNLNNTNIETSDSLND
jgi:hypothetical protein